MPFRILIVGLLDLRGVVAAQPASLAGQLCVAPTVAAADQISLVAGDIVVAARWATGDVVRFVARLSSRCDGPAVLVVSPATEPSGAVSALAAGADDHASWPIDPAELWARVRRLRVPPLDRSPAGRLRLGPLVIDQGLAEVRLDGVLIPLTPTQFSLLVALVEGEGTPVATEELLRRGWDAHQEATSDLLRPQLARLRRTLGARFLVANQRGVGYSLSLVDPVRGRGETVGGIGARRAS